jgi:hypothetical protein
MIAAMIAVQSVAMTVNVQIVMRTVSGRRTRDRKKRKRKSEIMC